MEISKFGLEVFINEEIIRRKYRIAVVSWPAVESPWKTQKHGFWLGVKGDIRMMLDIFRTISPFRALRQIAILKSRAVKLKDGEERKKSENQPRHPGIQ